MKYKNPGDMYNAFKEKAKSVKTNIKSNIKGKVKKVEEKVTKKLLSIPKGKAREEMVKLQVKK